MTGVIEAHSLIDMSRYAGAASPPGRSIVAIEETEAARGRFSQAMETARQAQQPTPAAPVAPAIDADANERARRALEIPPAEAAPRAEGDAILDGLQALRGVFDAQQGRVSAAMNTPVTDYNTLLNVQLELVNFSMLVEVASKLTGKSTQAFETLLKGQ